MSQTLSYAARPITGAEPIDVHDWRLTRPRAVAVAIVGVVLLVVHLFLYLVLPLDGPLTIGLFIAHFFAGASAALRWCDEPLHARWTRSQTQALAALAAGYVVIAGLTWSSLRADGPSELWLLPLVLFGWWWQGLKSASGYVAG